jgi:thiamine-phosphate pyrophosphorylase
VTGDSRKPGSPAAAGALPPLYPIIDIDICRMRAIDPVALAGACLAGGVRLLQVRQKGHDTGGAALLATVRTILAAARPAGARVIVNDRADIAAMAGADGVHVGQHDLRPEVVRRIAGERMLVGLSTHSPGQVDEALRGAADHIAVGPVFTTATKDTGYEARGLELVGYASGRGKPVVAIGGITLASAPAVLDAGADSVAIISDLLSDADVTTRIQQFLASIGR